jgi:hypothetical protein
MAINYYRILGVSEFASFSEIKEGFRRKVKECHPDRGGSHEQMVLVNEAWNILSNPSSRSDYDAFLRAKGVGGSGKYNEEKVARDQREARDKARHSPVGWDEIDKFLDQLNTDFGDSQYAESLIVLGSKSGMVFNAIAIMLIGIALAPIWLNYFHHGKAGWKELRGYIAGSGFIAVIILVVSASIHYWAGRIIRKINVGNKEKADVRVGGFKVIVCGSCGQKIRCPSLYKKMSIECPKCKTKFDMYGNGDQVLCNYKEEKSLLNSPASPLVGRILLLLCIALLILMLLLFAKLYTDFNSPSVARQNLFDSVFSSLSS